MSRQVVFAFAVFLWFSASAIGQVRRISDQMTSGEVQRLSSLLHEWQKLERHDKRYSSAENAFIKALDEVAASHERLHGIGGRSV